MWIDRLLMNPTTHALELTTSFSESRQRVLSENVANIDTPDYQQRQLDVAPFQSALRTAYEQARAAGECALPLPSHEQFALSAAQTLRTTPTVGGGDSVLLHDGTNASIDQLMSEAAANKLTHEFAITLLRGRYDNLMRAIRGRVT